MARVEKIQTNPESPMVYIFWTSPSIEEARKVITLLLEQRLIACGSIIPAVESYFWWQGKIDQGVEVKVILKTQRGLFSQVEETVCHNTGYQVPELTMISLEKVHAPYLQWLEDSLK
jgi:periplasmic divalent cation tolerance protein